MYYTTSINDRVEKYDMRLASNPTNTPTTDYTYYDNNYLNNCRYTKTQSNLNHHTSTVSMWLIVLAIIVLLSAFINIYTHIEHFEDDTIIIDAHRHYNRTYSQHKSQHLHEQYYEHDYILSHTDGNYHYDKRKHSIKTDGSIYDIYPNEIDPKHDNNINNLYHSKEEDLNSTRNGHLHNNYNNTTTTTTNTTHTMNNNNNNNNKSQKNHTNAKSKKYKYFKQEPWHGVEDKSIVVSSLLYFHHLFLKKKICYHNVGSDDSDDYDDYNDESIDDVENNQYTSIDAKITDTGNSHYINHSDLTNRIKYNAFASSEGRKY